MRPFPTAASRTSLRLIARPLTSQLPRTNHTAKMSTGTPASPPNLDIQNKNIQTGPGVTLSEDQRTVIGSVLDLFAGLPSLQKLALWRDDATFADPITIAQGREKYSAQWYGLQAAFSKIELQSHTVTSSGNPISISVRNKYTIKGIGKEQTIDSQVLIHTDDKGFISKVEDKWNGELPDSSIANAFRHLNAVTVPKFVSVPKNEQEDAKKRESK